MPSVRHATNVNISGGTFSHIKGDYIVYDHSRLETNINSHNVRDNTITGSYNATNGGPGPVPKSANLEPSQDSSPLPGLDIFGDPNIFSGGSCYNRSKIPPKSRTVFNHNANNTDGNVIIDFNSFETEYDAKQPSPKGTGTKGKDPEDVHDGCRATNGKTKQYEWEDCISLSFSSAKKPAMAARFPSSQPKSASGSASRSSPPSRRDYRYSRPNNGPKGNPGKGPKFEYIEGNVTKHDYSVVQQNWDSYNVKGNTVRGSYNKTYSQVRSRGQF